MNRKRRLLVVCPHPTGVAPGQRLKFEQYFDFFEANGFEVTVSPFMTRRFWNVVYKRGHIAEKVLWTIWGYLRRVRDLFRIPLFDGVYVFLWVTPFGPPLFERLVAALNKRLVYDIDDMVFLGHASKANRLIARLKGRSKMLFMMRRAKHVIVCTPHLDNFVRQFNPRTTDISSTIDTDAYFPVIDYAEDRPLTLGWSGSHSTSKYLRLLEPVLRDVTRSTDARILVIGDPQFRFVSLDAETLPWHADSEVSDLRRIDIGLYPLPNEEWVLGKSGLKALQYMALGIPTVASAIGANFRVIEDGVSGFLVRSDDEWRARLLELIRDAALRRRIGTAARARVENHYSVKANRDTYLAVLNEVVPA